jgi:hypothetical protein
LWTRAAAKRSRTWWCNWWAHSAGRFRIPGVVPGDYVLNVSTVGYHLLKRSFHLDAGETKDFEVILSPETFHPTDSVEVQASPFEPSRQDSPSTLVLGGNDAKNLASVLADDPLRSVQGLPGGNRIECRAC